MDGIVRCVREGRPTAADAAPLVLVLDDLSVVGGGAIFHTILREVCEAVSQQRSQASRVSVLALDQAPVHYRAVGTQHIIDGFTDPWGWAAAALQQHTKLPEQTPEQQQQHEGRQQQQQQQQPPPADLELLLGMAAQTREGQAPVAGPAASSSGQCIAIDSISTLLMRHNPMDVLACLTALTASPGVASILAVVHADLHDAHTLHALECLSAATVRLTPPESIDIDPVAARPASHPQPLGRMRCSWKRRTGRLRVESCCYGLAMDADGGSKLQVYPLPPEEGKLDAQELVKRALAAGQLTAEAASAAHKHAPAVPTLDRGWESPSKAAWGAPTQQAGQQQQQQQQESQEEALLRKLNSSMRLGLSEQERAAREQVVLPYEHRGEGRQYNTRDFKDYLPPAAGGHGAGSQSVAAGDGSDANGSGMRLGHILYVRDSEGEHDSDEDPDDDLDI